ncbi:MAG TPA: hypothetical protein VHY84_16020 [Bryobacteraceae bacterium]|jgi:hypothetical protein|nr:hypothetical protein [Bryobacteraceae bacterium]
MTTAFIRNNLSTELRVAFAACNRNGEESCHGSEDERVGQKRERGHNIDCVADEVEEMKALPPVTKRKIGCRLGDDD